MDDERNPEAKRSITVSRDALRADLAEMELRLRVWIGEQLSEKADAVALQTLALRVAAAEAVATKFAAGDFTPAQDRAFAVLIDDKLKEHMDIGWTRRQRWIAVISLIVAIFAVAVSVFIAVHYTHVG